MARCGVVRREDLHRVMAAAPQAVDIVVRQMRDELRQFRVLVEEVLAVEARRRSPQRSGTRRRRSRGRRSRSQQVRIAREQRIPVAAPQQLDHIPAGAGEESLELLDDRAVAAHRAVEPLQVAVDDEHQVVEPSRAAIDRPASDSGSSISPSPTKAQTLRASGARRGRDAPDSAGNAPGRSRTAARVPSSRSGTARSPASATDADTSTALARGLAPIVVELLGGQPPFEEGARVNARRRMRLEVDQVTARVGRIAAGAEEVVEADLEEIRRRCVARDMAAELGDSPGWRARPSRARSSARSPRAAARSRGCRGTAPVPPARSCSGTAYSAPAAMARAACARAAATASAERSRAAGPSAAISASSASIHSRVSCGSPSSSGRRHAAFGINFARSSRFMARCPAASSGAPMLLVRLGRMLPRKLGLKRSSRHGEARIRHLVDPGRAAACR